MDRTKRSDNIKFKIPKEKRTQAENNVLKRYSDLLFRNHEYQYAHNSYENERREMACIENGDVEGLEQCWNTTAESLNNNDSVFFGYMAKDWSRNVKNLCISVIALASRAAIRGGMHPEDAFSLCDCYVQEIEQSDDISVLADLALRSELHFAEQVRNIKNNSSHPDNKSPHIVRCKDYIFAHLHDKLTVQEIADALHLNPNYLSELFIKQEGKSMLEYILKEKVKLIKNMLTYSEYTYSEIATYLGFSSQSHMGTQFKKVTGMTLREYRNKYHIQDAPFS